MERVLYKGYLLSATPMPGDDGRFQARVSITAMSGERTRAQRFLDLEYFDTEADASAHALQAGRQWVDDNGDAPSATTALSAPGRTPRPR
jgi:hypothetical protein